MTDTFEDEYKIPVDADFDPITVGLERSDDFIVEEYCGIQSDGLSLRGIKRCVYYI